MRIGIDLGGTKIEFIALSDGEPGAGPDGGNVLVRHRVATPVGDYDATVRTIRDGVAAIERQTSATGTVGVGIPGTLSPATGLIKNANSIWLIGRPFDRDLETALARPVRLANDANCFTLSEATDGAAAGLPVVFGIILGTGVGGGIALNGQPLRGANAIAGEWGHNPLPWPEPSEIPGSTCYCGQSGCIETFLSGPALARGFAASGGPALTAEAIVQRAAEGDKQAERALVTFEHRLARSLAHIINILDPDAIVMGGGLSNMTRLYGNVPALWSKWVFSDRVDTKLLAPRHGDSSGVRGAAWLWPPGG
jgi:fructokinase